jgi:hypothetical protein
MENVGVGQMDNFIEPNFLRITQGSDVAILERKWPWLSLPNTKERNKCCTLGDPFLC